MSDDKAVDEGSVDEDGLASDANSDTGSGDSVDGDKGSADFAIPDDFDWRGWITKGDEARQKTVQRYATPDKVVDALVNAQRKISSGEYIPKLEGNPTEKEIAAYRKSMGIPDSTDEYQLALPEDIEIDDVTKNIIEDFRQSAHNVNIPQAQASKIAEWFLEYNDMVGQEQAEMDVRFAEEAEEELRSLYGSEYKANVQAANNMIAEYMGDKAPDFLNQQLISGGKVGDNPAFVQMLVDLARSNPSHDFMFDSGSGSTNSVDERISELRKLMNSDNASERKEYWSDKVQSELTDLYTRKARSQGMM
jgi:hypothetical protein